MEYRFKVGDRVKRVELLNSGMSEYFGGEPFTVKESHPTYVVDPNGGQHGHQFLRPVEGPVRTVTRREIIPGTYDGVGIKDYSVPEWVIVEIGEQRMTADELDRAAAVLTALAGALRDGK